MSTFVSNPSKGTISPPSWIRPTAVLLTLFSLAVLGMPNPALGQGYAELNPGSVIRVVPMSGPVQVGTFQSSSPEGLAFEPEDGSLAVLPHGSIQKVQVPDGKNRLKPGMIGGGIGLAAGLIIGGLTSGDCSGDCDDPYGVGDGSALEANATATGALIGGVVFGAIGAAVGALGFPRDRWRDVDPGPGGRE